MNLHPCIMLRNEEYWIYYILRDLVQVFPVLVYDTGSRDATCDIIRDNFPEVELVCVGIKAPGDLGKLRQEMFSEAGYPAMKVDGDEWYPLETLKQLKNAVMPPSKALGFINTRTIGIRDSIGTVRKTNQVLYEREGKSTDAIYCEEVTWEGNYPDEHHSLWPQTEKYHYFSGEWWALHLHHLVRSSLDRVTMGRAVKRDNYVPTADKGNIDLTVMMSVEDSDPFNPYFHEE